MSIASLVVRLAQGKPQNDIDPKAFHSSTDPKSLSLSGHHNRPQNAGRDQVKSIQLSSRTKKGGGMIKSAGLSKINSNESLGGIKRQTDLNVVVERINHKGAGSSTSSDKIVHSVFGDKIPLHKNGVQVKGRQL